uniref:Uncharacterized protein n=1 Tax=Timema tahoe TaxID=61484 RepID=A0A7R9IMG0_9NEOP|nr:unnamed protein product [Timema tahoe]
MSSRVYHHVVTSLNLCRGECITMSPRSTHVESSVPPCHLAQPMSSRVYHHVVTSLNLCRGECITMSPRSTHVELSVPPCHLTQPMSRRVVGDGDTHAPVLTPPWTPAGRGLTPGPCKPSWGTDRPAVGEEVESGMETSLNVRTKGQVPPPPPSFGCGGSYQERPLTQLTRAPCTVTPLPQVPALKFDSLFVILVRLSADIPTQVPPLTPGTNKKMTEALKASFASWEKEQLRLNIVKVLLNLQYCHPLGKYTGVRIARAATRTSHRVADSGGEGGKNCVQDVFTSETFMDDGETNKAHPNGREFNPSHVF